MTATDKMALNSLYRCETISSIILMDYMREENERANNQFKLLKDNEQGERKRREGLTTMVTKMKKEIRALETVLETKIEHVQTEVGSKVLNLCKKVDEVKTTIGANIQETTTTNTTTTTEKIFDGKEYSFPFANRKELKCFSRSLNRGR